MTTKPLVDQTTLPLDYLTLRPTMMHRAISDGCYNCVTGKETKYGKHVLPPSHPPKHINVYRQQHINDILVDGHVLSTVHNGARVYIASVTATENRSGFVDLAFQFAPPTETLDNKLLSHMVTPLEQAYKSADAAHKADSRMYNDQEAQHERNDKRNQLNSQNCLKWFSFCFSPAILDRVATELRTLQFAQALQAIDRILLVDPVLQEQRLHVTTDLTHPTQRADEQIQSFHLRVLLSREVINRFEQEFDPLNHTADPINYPTIDGLVSPLASPDKIMYTMLLRGATDGANSKAYNCLRIIEFNVPKDKRTTKDLLSRLVQVQSDYNVIKETRDKTKTEKAKSAKPYRELLTSSDSSSDNHSDNQARMGKFPPKRGTFPKKELDAATLAAFLCTRCGLNGHGSSRCRTKACIDCKMIHRLPASEYLSHVDENCPRRGTTTQSSKSAIPTPTSDSDFDRPPTPEEYARVLRWSTQNPENIEFARACAPTLPPPPPPSPPPTKSSRQRRENTIPQHAFLASNPPST